MDDFEKELKLDFLQEATDLLGQTEASFLDLERDPSNKTLLDTIFRFAHNLKGTSRAVGLGQVAEFTHRAENVLLKLKEGSVPVTEKVVSVLLKFNDQVQVMVAGLSENLDSTFDCENLMLELDDIAAGNVSSTSDAVVEEQLASEVSEVDLTEESVSPAPSMDDFSAEEMMAAFDNGTLNVESFQIKEETPVEVVIPKIVVQEAPKVELVKEPIKSSENKTPQKKEKDDETIRVSLGRLDKLGDLVGELVILQSVVDRAMSSSAADAKTARALSKLCKNIQDLSMSLRMVPVSTTFQKLHRIVRDTSKVLNKKIDLRIIGEATEIDRTVLEHLGDPLVHLVRNSVDHGIEMPDERLRSGKPEQGVVEVMAVHEGNYLVIQITDDGKGMDSEKLISKAREKNILRKDQVLTEQEALNLIFHPGFSTKDQVSEVSGRGVGMDVVKTNIESLGGEIKLQSKVGVGSCIRLILPLTLAIIDGMLVSAGGQRFILPRNQVHEINRLEDHNIHLAGGKTPFYRLRDEVLPLFNLSSDLGHPGQKDLIALVVRTGGHAFAVAVEDVIRQQQVVVKPPTEELVGKPGMMGTTILGDGYPALIIDLIDLYAKKMKKDLAKKVA